MPAIKDSFKPDSGAGAFFFSILLWGIGIGSFAAKLVDERSHAVDAAVTGANHGDVLALSGFIDGHLTPLGLPGHRSGHKLLTGIAFLHQIHIHGVADDHIAVLQCPVCPDGHILIVTGANAHNDQLTQSVPPVFPPQLRLSHHLRQFSLRLTYPHP